MTDLSPFWISLQVAGMGTCLMLPFGICAAWWFAHGRSFRGKSLIETLFTLPLVLPPTVVGFYLLLVFGRGTAFGKWMNDAVGVHLLFTREGAAVAAAIMALPMFVRTATAAFAAVDVSLLEAARIQGAGEWTVLICVTIPVAYKGLFAGFALAFARALGEFGATLMIAGSIPGQTQTLPLALYASVQASNNRQAWIYTALLTLVAFVILNGVGVYQNRISRGRGE